MIYIIYKHRICSMCCITDKFNWFLEMNPRKLMEKLWIMNIKYNFELE